MFFFNRIMEDFLAERSSEILSLNLNVRDTISAPACARAYVCTVYIYTSRGRKGERERGR